MVDFVLCFSSVRPGDVSIPRTMSFEFDDYYYYYYYFDDIDLTYFAAVAGVVLVFGREIRFAAVDEFQTP